MGFSNTQEVMIITMEMHKTNKTHWDWSGIISQRIDDHTASYGCKPKTIIIDAEVDSILRRTQEIVERSEMIGHYWVKGEVMLSIFDVENWVIINDSLLKEIE